MISLINVFEFFNLSYYCSLRRLYVKLLEDRVLRLEVYHWTYAVRFHSLVLPPLPFLCFWCLWCKVMLGDRPGSCFCVHAFPDRMVWIPSAALCQNKPFLPYVIFIRLSYHRIKTSTEIGTGRRIIAILNLAEVHTFETSLYDQWGRVWDSWH